MKTIHFILALIFLLYFNLVQTTAQQQPWQRVTTIDSLQANWVYAISATPAALFVNVYIPTEIQVPSNYERRKILVSQNHGQTWTETRWKQSTTASINTLFPLPFGEAYIFSYALGTIFTRVILDEYLAKSTDSGKTWEIHKALKTEQNGFQDSVVYAESVLTMGNKLLIIWQSRLFYSLDAGKTILRDTSGDNIQTPIIGFRGMIKSRNTLWAAAGNGLFASNDTGKTWVKRSIPPGAKIECCYQIAPVTESLIIAQAFRDSLSQSFYSQYISQDSGKSWKQLSLLSPKETISNAVSFGTRIYLATTPGLFYSNDQGQTWQKESGKNGLPDGRIRALELSGTTLFVSVNERGLYTLDLTTVSAREEPQNTLFISSPAPNPSSDYADIAFTLSCAAQAGVTLYSTLGTEVWRSESSTFSAGEQHIRIDTRHLPTGVYAYRLVVDGVSSVGRIVVVR